MTELLAFIGAWALCCGAFWAIFERVETVATPEFRMAVGDLLSKARLRDGVTGWPDSFIRVFDRIFGERHLTWDCFFGSGLASIFAVLVMAIVTWVGWPDSIYKTFLPITEDSFPLLGFSKVAAGLIVLALIVNLIPDYFSLLETRWLLHRLSHRRATFDLLIFVILDIVFTYFVFVLFVFALFSLLAALFGKPLPNLYYIVTRTASAAVLKEASIGFSIFVWSTFFTSIWIWLYASSVILVKIVHATSNRYEWFKRSLGLGRKRLFDIENKPFRTIGLMTNLIITFLFLVGGMVKWVF